MLAPRNLLSLWLLVLSLHPIAARASVPPPDPRSDILRVVLTSGDTLRARCVQPASFEITTRDNGTLLGVKVGLWPGAVAGTVAALGVLIQSLPSLEFVP